jgi:DNA modification methylase
MEIKEIDINLIKPYENNAKKHDKKQIQQVADSIKRFGFVQPLVIDKDNNLIIGHCRLESAKLLGLKEVPVLQLENLTDKEVIALRLADNKLNESAWDIKLAVTDLKLLDDDLFNLTGFNKDLLIEPDDKDDIVPEVKDIKSKLGDLYILGKHRVLCGDSTKKEDVDKLMDGQKADMVFTDPPYGVNYGKKNEFLNSISFGNRIQTDIQNDVLNIKDISILWANSFRILSDYLEEYSTYFICAPQGGDLLMMMMMMNENGLPLRHSIIWNKNNHVLGRTDYNYKHETILYGWKDKHKFYGNGSQKFSVWDFDKPVKSDLHPTMKPVELIINAILNNSLENQNIVDIFLGSGSTLIACEKSNRICYGMEIDPHYIDVIVQRHVDFTGNNKIIKNGEEIIWEKTQKTQ